MHSERIVLDTTVNTRDLGGIAAADGRKIKSGRLIRSSRIHDLSDADIKKLTELNLKRVVDFRTYYECECSPDTIITGVQYTNIPVLTEAAMGITKEKTSRFDNLLRLEREFATTGGNPILHMRDMYVKIITSTHAHGAYKQFMQLLLDDNGGATLWHCSAGKDRAGLGAVFAEYALGVSFEFILEDYLATNLFTAEENQKFAQEVFEGTGSRYAADASIEFATVHELYLQTALDYFDKEFGGIDGFMKKALGIGENEKQRLRSIYLD